MTDGLIIYDKANSASVDLTSNNPRVTRGLINPMVVIALPADKAAAISKQYGIDLMMVQDIITIDCILTDGIGSNNPASPSTKYEKLVSLMLNKNSKHLVWGPTTMTKYIVGMLSLNFTNEAGQKNILHTSIKLAVLAKEYGSA